MKARARLSSPSVLSRAESDGLSSHARLRRAPDPSEGPVLRTRAVFIGPYQVVAELARGGMASVYLAIKHGDQGFEKACALKRIHAHLASDPAFSEMFIDEARITARISHPYVCNVFDFGDDDNGGYYLAMEFLRGETLSRILSVLSGFGARGDFERLPHIGSRIVADLAEGLYAAHTLKGEDGQPLDVVHRDVTPQNLFVLYDGTVRVSDFGIAHARQRIHQTRGDRIKGKLAYMAPEQLERRDIDHRVDIWALGVVLWEFLTGRRLFRCGSEAETVLAVLSKDIPKPSSLNPHVTPELDRIVARALSRDVERRYASARDLSRDLEHFLAKQGDSVPTMDLAEWMFELFPDGAKRFEAMLDVARAVAIRRARLPEWQSDAPDAPEAERTEETTLRKPPSEPTVVERPVEPPRKRRGLAYALASVALPAALLVGFLRLAPGEKPSAEVASPQAARPEGARETAPPSEVLAEVEAPALSTVEPSEVVFQVDQLAPEEPEQPEPEPAAKPRGRAPVSGRTPSSSQQAKSRPAEQGASAQTGTGSVLITTPGGSAQIFDGSRLLGTSPLRSSLPAGSRSLTLRLADGTERRFGVEITAGAMSIVTIPITVDRRQ